MMRTSATVLETFHLFRTQPWMTEGELLQSIRGEFRPAPERERKIALGQGFGRVLERPTRYKVAGGYEATIMMPSGTAYLWRFADATMEQAFAYMDYTYGRFELKTFRDYGDVRVVSKADQVVGVRLLEHKAVADTPDLEKYIASYQWRCMADAFQPLVITYLVFQLEDHDNTIVELRDVEVLNLYPYPGLHVDCCALVDEFREYVVDQGLVALLEGKQAFAEGLV